MAGVPFAQKLNFEQIGRLMRSDRLLDRLEARGWRMARAAGPGYTVERWVGKTRVRATVVTDTREAMRDSAVNHSLLKAIDAGRGK